MSDNLVDKGVLKSFVPPSALNAENFQELAGKAVVEEVAAGKTIFKPGDNDRKTVYLIEGELEITSEAGEKTTLQSGADLAKHPVANFQPRKHTVVASSACKISSRSLSILVILQALQAYRGCKQCLQDNQDRQ